MRMDYGQRARALVGTRFRPQGRAATGLDCVGLVVEVFALETAKVRRDYRLRGDHRDELTHGIERDFRKVGKAARVGDLLLMQLASDQLHLGIRTPEGFVHAHAGIGRVVETPGDPAWPVLGVYRKRRKAR